MQRQGHKTYTLKTQIYKLKIIKLNQNNKIGYNGTGCISQSIQYQTETHETPNLTFEAYLYKDNVLNTPPNATINSYK